MTLSIITINLNNLHGLMNTAKSVINQTCNDFEWIVIDGGSMDGSCEYLKSIENHITHWISEPDSGVYNAMNKGLEKAKGDYFLFLNSGDYFRTENIINDFIALPKDGSLIYSDAILVDHNGNTIDIIKTPSTLNISYFWAHTLCHQAVFYRKECFNSYRYNECNRIASDVESFIYLGFHNFKFQKWDEIVVNFEAGGLSSQDAPDEFQSLVKRNIPDCILRDYEKLISYRDVDLTNMITRIVDSSKFVRYITRILLYPYFYLLRGLKLIK